MRIAVCGFAHIKRSSAREFLIIHTAQCLARTISSVLWHAQYPRCFCTHNVLNDFAHTMFGVLTRAISSELWHAQCPRCSGTVRIMFLMLWHTQCPLCSDTQNIHRALALTMFSVLWHAQCPRLANTMFSVLWHIQCSQCSSTRYPQCSGTHNVLGS